jgi:hypothetical protein
VDLNIYLEQIADVEVLKPLPEMFTDTQPAVIHLIPEREYDAHMKQRVEVGTELSPVCCGLRTFKVHRDFFRLCHVRMSGLGFPAPALI